MVLRLSGLELHCLRRITSFAGNPRLRSVGALAEAGEGVSPHMDIIEARALCLKQSTIRLDGKEHPSGRTGKWKALPSFFL